MCMHDAAKVFSAQQALLLFDQAVQLDTSLEPVVAPVHDSVEDWLAGRVVADMGWYLWIYICIYIYIRCNTGECNCDDV